MTERSPRVMVLASCVWNFYQRSTPLCGHLARLGAGIDFVEPLVYRDAREAHLLAEGPQPVPDGVRVLRRRSRVRRGALLALWQNIYYAWTALRLRADAVIIYPAQFSLFAALALRFTRTRVVLDYIDDWPEWAKAPMERKMLRYFFIPWVARLADACVVTAELLGRDIESHARALHWIPNGADEPPASESKIEFGAGEGLLFVGGLAPRIDIEWLIGLAESMPETSMTVLGGGEQHPKLAAAARRLPNLTAPGAVPHDEAVAAIRAAAICLIAYRPGRLADRCFPIKLTEYWALGRPVVAAPTHEIRRVGGEIVRFAETGAGAAVVCRELLADRAGLERLGRAGHAEAAKYHYEVLAKQFLDVLQGRSPRS